MDKVFLVHGLWLSGYASWYWRWVMRQAGLQTVVFSYPSVAKTLDDNAGRLFKVVQAQLKGKGDNGENRGEGENGEKATPDASQASQQQPRLHFVGHSLGGLVILRMLQLYGDKLPMAHRVVLCGSPVNGSYCAKTGVTWPLIGRAFLGKSIVQWRGLDENTLPKHVEVGTIAGTRALGLGRIMPGLPQPSDGTVSLSETVVKSAKDKVVMHVNHSELLIAPAVGRQIVSFIKQGVFLHHV